MSKGDISGLHKTAIFMLTLGEELASEVLSHLDEEEISKITDTMYEFKTIPGDQVLTVLEEFSRDASSNEVMVPTSGDYVNNLLERTIVKRDQSMRPQSTAVSSSQKTIVRKSLTNVDPRTLARLIGDEPPQIIALILYNLEPKVASRAIKELPHALQGQIVSRMAQLGEVHPDVMEEVQGALHRKLQDMGSLSVKKMDGMEIVAQMINSLDKESGDVIIEKIREYDSKLADEIKQRLFTFEDLTAMDDRTMQLILSKINTQSLGVALKGVSPDLHEKVFRNLSQRAGEMLKEDMEVMGPVKRAEVYKAQLEIVESVKKLEEEGKIQISRGEDDVIA